MAIHIVEEDKGKEIDDPKLHKRGKRVKSLLTIDITEECQPEKPGVLMRYVQGRCGPTVHFTDERYEVGSDKRCRHFTLETIKNGVLNHNGFTKFARQIGMQACVLQRVALAQASKASFGSKKK